jgi:hypothetical protein
VDAFGIPQLEAMRCLKMSTTHLVLILYQWIHQLVDSMSSMTALIRLWENELKNKNTNFGPNGLKNFVIQSVPS